MNEVLMIVMAAGAVLGVTAGSLASLAYLGLRRRL